MSSEQKTIPEQFEELKNDMKVLEKLVMHQAREMYRIEADFRSLTKTTLQLAEIVAAIAPRPTKPAEPTKPTEPTKPWGWNEPPW